MNNLTKCYKFNDYQLIVRGLTTEIYCIGELFHALIYFDVADAQSVT